VDSVLRAKSNGTPEEVFVTAQAESAGLAGVAAARDAGERRVRELTADAAAAAAAAASELAEARAAAAAALAPHRVGARGQAVPGAANTGCHVCMATKTVLCHALTRTFPAPP